MSVVMRTSPALINGNSLQYFKIRNCHCCPYGYHIDLDFVRHCEALGNDEPTEQQLRHKHKRLSRKSMEFMLGVGNIIEQEKQTCRAHCEPEVTELSEYAIVEVSGDKTDQEEKTSTHLKDSLHEVVSEFERTLERTSKSRKEPQSIQPWVECRDTIHFFAANKKQKQCEIDVNKSKIPPSPPPRQFKVRNNDFSVKTQTMNVAVVSESIILNNIRQQMVKSLHQMKDLEEKVTTIPTLKNQLEELQNKHRELQDELKNKRDELDNIRKHVLYSQIQQSFSTSSPTKNSAINVPLQRSSSFSLDDLNSQKKNKISTVSDRSRTNYQVLKRDVGSMCNSQTRDIGIGSNSVVHHNTGTNTYMHNSDIFEKLYTKTELNKNIENCMKTYEEKFKREHKKKMISVGTQMFSKSKSLRDVSVQTLVELPILKCSIGIMARPKVRDVMIHCSPKKHAPSSSECNNSILSKTDNVGPTKKSIGTQYQNKTNSVGFQTSPSVSSIGVQNDLIQNNECSFNYVLNKIPKTDTVLATSEMNSDQPKPSKPTTANNSCNTDSIATNEQGVNTLSEITTKHSSSNTEQLHIRDIGCGKVATSRIANACIKDYCDLCRDAIKNLAKDFLKTETNSSSTRDASKIPRPKRLSSLSPVRKNLVYKDSCPASQDDKKEKSSLFEQNLLVPISLASIESQSSSTKNVNNGMKQKPIHQKQTNKADDLIVKEETRVKISWSRESSPGPSSSPTSTVQAVTEELALNNIKDEERKNLTAKSINKSPNNPTVKEERTEILESHPLSSQRNRHQGQTMFMDQIISQENRQKFLPSKEVQAALKVINDSLQKISSKSVDLKNATAVIQMEWFNISSTEMANPLVVEDYLDSFEEFSNALLKFVVNLMDTNGNTAMHYAVSHGNFDIVSVLLDSKVCNVNQMNNAGYTCVMLVSLAKLHNPAHQTVVQRMFQMADVNIRAKKHCQTALMLAVSHGNLDMVEMLLVAGADINIQDEDGSTALMCAAEHGRVDIVKLLLSQSDCDSLIQDVDGSTAFKIAWQAGHRDIGLLLYVHEQMLRSKIPSQPEQRT